MEKLSVITEQGDLGLGTRELTEAEQQQIERQIAERQKKEQQK